MSNKIIVTDSLFIFDEHVKQLEAAGYEVERLDKPNATEEELVEAVKGKVGYILGGIENVTDKVIDAADELKVVASTAVDYQKYIPAFNEAKAKGIAITVSRGSNADAVSEFAMGVAIAMQRNLFDLGRTGDKTFQTTDSLYGSVIGVIGAGNVGSKIITSSKAFNPSKLLYNSRSPKEVDAEFVGLDELVEQSDIIFVAVPVGSGQLFGETLLSKVKKNALIVSVSPVELFDVKVLLKRLQGGTLRTAIDWPAPTEEFTKLPLDVWFNTNDHTAYNTHQANKLASDMAVESLLNVLNTGEDQYRVN